MTTVAAKVVRPAPPERATGQGSLWRNRDFVKLWGGQTASQAGSRMSDLALPLTGILLLDATPGQLGLLAAAEFSPLLLVTLFAGVWADRHARRPILFVANVGRALLIGLVPALAVSGVLTMPILCAIAFSVGTLTAVFDVTYVAYVPSLVDREQLVEGNSKLQASYSVAQVAGQGSSGVLVQLLTAPGALLVDALTYLLAAFSVLSIRHRETARPPASRGDLRREVAEGLKMTLGNRVLRPLMLQSAAFNGLNAIVVVVLPVYALRSLELSPATLGLVIASGSLGALAGAMGAGRLGRRIGVGPAMTLGMATACLSFLAIPLASGGRAAVIAVLVATYCVFGAGLAVFNVHSLSIRQTVVPTEMMGRVASVYRLASWAMIPAGSLLGGLLANVLGLRTTLLVAAAGLTLSAVLFAWSQLTPARREHPLVHRPRRRAHATGHRRHAGTVTGAGTRHRPPFRPGKHKRNTKRDIAARSTVERSGGSPRPHRQSQHQ